MQHDDADRSDHTGDQARGDRAAAEVPGEHAEVLPVGVDREVHRREERAHHDRARRRASMWG